MINDINEMKRLLRAVPDSYDDFVSGMLDFHWDDLEKREAMYRYLVDHPNARTDEAMMYMEQFLDLHDFEKEGYPETPVATPVTEVVA